MSLPVCWKAVPATYVHVNFSEISQKQIAPKYKSQEDFAMSWKHCISATWVSEYILSQGISDRDIFFCSIKFGRLFICICIDNFGFGLFKAAVHSYL